MKEKSSVFLKNSGAGFVRDMLTVVVFAVLMLVFWLFKQYVAFVFAGAILIVVLVGILSMVLVSKTELRVITWGKVSTRISIEELQTIETHAGKPETMTFLGAEDLFTCNYNKKLLKTVLLNLDFDEKTIDSFIMDGEDYHEKCGKWTLERDNVLLDVLYGKKKYVHRRVNCYAKDDIFG